MTGCRSFISLTPLFPVVVILAGVVYALCTHFLSKYNFLNIFKQYQSVTCFSEYRPAYEFLVLIAYAHQVSLLVYTCTKYGSKRRLRPNQI